MCRHCLEQILILTTIYWCKELHQIEENHEVLKAKTKDGIWKSCMLSGRKYTIV
jgi:hypothetical protein